jgi:hypothetical protein
MGLEVDRYAVGFHHGLERIGNLLTNSFLDRKAPGKEAHEAGELRDADDVLVRDVADVGPAEERQAVVLTEREER